MGYVCSVCGDYHAERLLDVRLGLPDPIYALTASEREARARLADDFATLDGAQFYVRGLLELPIIALGTSFGYGVWVEVDRRRFTHVLGRWTSPEQFEPFRGALANELDPYTNTLGLATISSAVSADSLPTVTIVDTDHELARDQREGITVERADELASSVLHA